MSSIASVDPRSSQAASAAVSSDAATQRSVDTASGSAAAADQPSTVVTLSPEGAAASAAPTKAAAAAPAQSAGEAAKSAGAGAAAGRVGAAGSGSKPVVTEKADTDENGKVSQKEQLAYDNAHPKQQAEAARAYEATSAAS